MYKETRDDALLHKYWVEERTNTPLWFQNSHDTWGFSWEECKAFHNGCWKIFEFDNVLIYVEKIGDYANIHFSIVRGADAWKLVEEFKALRDELFNDFKMVFGWVNTKNRMLKRLIEDVGFQYEGFEMLNGHTHGQLLKWHCYVAKKQIVIPSVSV